MINREDMLELTRRMTPKRTHISRIAGAYLDKDGFIDGTFNTQFLKLSEAENQAKLQIAKAIPYAKSNENLKEYTFANDTSDIYRLLSMLRDCALENDALLDVLYEQIADCYLSPVDYAILVYYGAYDVPTKFADGSSYYESDTVFKYILLAISPLQGEYEPSEPVAGFLFPAFADRAADLNRIDIYFASSPDSAILSLLNVE